VRVQVPPPPLKISSLIDVPDVIAFGTKFFLNKGVENIPALE